MNTTRGSVTEKRIVRAAQLARLERQNGLLKDLAILTVLTAWAFFVNRGLRMSGYYMDDLYMWSCWGEQSFFEYVFPVGSTRCRFVYWLAAWAELLLIGNHIEWVVPLNILMNAGLAAFLYFFAKRLAKSRGAGFAAGILFLSSRFAYYQTGQLLGLMETMGVFFALLTALCLKEYMDEDEEGRTMLMFAAGLLFWFLNCFTHERYMVLLPMFYFSLAVKRDRKVLRWLLPAAAFALVLAIRFMMIGTLSPAGTGGTNVAETITKRGVVVNFFLEAAYACGFNFGPEHLCGLPWQGTPFALKILIVLLNAATVMLFCILVYTVWERRRFGLPVLPVLRDMVFFLGFAIGCAASAAVTIRVEMRWVYVVYAFKLLLFARLIGACRETRVTRQADGTAGDRYRISDRFPVILVAVISVFTVFTQLEYRKYWPKIYLFPNQARYNSLADETYGKYGQDILGKEIIIIGNLYEMSDFTAETFFKTFDPERTGQGTTVRHVDSILDFGQVTDNMIILKEDPAHDAFTDATDLVRSLKLGIDYGYYRDGWMDERAKLRVMTGSTGNIRMEMMYPGNLTGRETVSIKKDGATVIWPLTSNISEYTIHGEPYRITELEFTQNFHVEPAAEQRGEDRLALIVNFVTE